MIINKISFKKNSVGTQGRFSSRKIIRPESLLCHKREKVKVSNLPVFKYLQNSEEAMIKKCRTLKDSLCQLTPTAETSTDDDKFSPRRT